MKNLKKITIALMMMFVFMVGNTFANTGILVAGIATDEPQPCIQETNGNSKVSTSYDFTGILVAGITGVIIGDFTGILVAGVVGEANVDCGILVAG